MDEHLLRALAAHHILGSLSGERGNRDPWAELLTQCRQARHDDGDSNYLDWRF
ncbi:hypothetical protein [Mycobacterium heckeshornense]|uniref:Uncharacterized protein n=1 Tax=Mycobacterium heckeshornense TaxID=110505 RepID=A0A7R7JHC2_9MYCO|nr:hypothetical protein [Mycobacterium heckeshornense]MCV7032863.1 hypothetical protein [Mycobacterium heckeshornense]BCO35508.1 hypothetical protein MHEC_19410 [Mycobacterium heckeshornense]